MLPFSSCTSKCVSGHLAYVTANGSDNGWFSGGNTLVHTAKMALKKGSCITYLVGVGGLVVLDFRGVHEF